MLPVGAQIHLVFFGDAVRADRALEHAGLADLAPNLARAFRVRGERMREPHLDHFEVRKEGIAVRAGDMQLSIRKVDNLRKRVPVVHVNCDDCALDELGRKLRRVFRPELANAPVVRVCRRRPESDPPSFFPSCSAVLNSPIIADKLDPSSSIAYLLRYGRFKFEV